jgi:hypothetical protein
MTASVKPVTTPEQLKAAYEKHGSLKAVARATGQSREVIRKLYHHAVAAGVVGRIRTGGKTREHEILAAKGKLEAPPAKPHIGGRKKALQATVLKHDAEGVTRMLFTCAQNNTKLFDAGWENLQVLKDVYRAQLHISRFAYMRNGLGARGDKSAYFTAMQDHDKSPKDFWFDPRIIPYISDDRLEVAPGLVWCGESNIIPTAAKPLSGLETFTARKSGIFPHVKIQMASVPSAKLDPVKYNYTTGTITQRNYIQRKEGLKAEFHHCYGALLVEVEPNGDWWCRQINMDSDGTIYDIDICIKKGVVTTTNPAIAKRLGCELVKGPFVEGIKWGDTHVSEMDPVIRKAIWGKGGYLDQTKARYQFVDDSFNMMSRNHWDADDPHKLLKRFAEGKDDVKAEMQETVQFYYEAMRPFTQTVIVNSNHDRALMRWLADKRAQFDPTNMAFWHRMNMRVSEHIVVNKSFPVVLREAFFEVTRSNAEPKGLHFLAQDEGFIICPNAGGGIENGVHGDEGANGARGSTASYAQQGRKMNKGHSHVAEIIDSVYSSGCCLDLKSPPDYVHGASSWSNSHIATYQNGKRQIWSMWGPERKMWADRG